MMIFTMYPTRGNHGVLLPQKRQKRRISPSLPLERARWMCQSRIWISPWAPSYICTSAAEVDKRISQSVTEGYEGVWSIDTYGPASLLTHTRFRPEFLIITVNCCSYTRYVFQVHTYRNQRRPSPAFFASTSAALAERDECYIPPTIIACNAPSASALRLACAASRSALILANRAKSFCACSVLPCA